MNDGRATPRTNLVKRVAAGPAHVKRLGHAVLNVTDFRVSERWYKDRFGFITSDEIEVPGLPDSMGAFMRCDRGEEPTDHHSMFLVGAGSPRFNHAAFEVADYDDLMAAGSVHKAREAGTRAPRDRSASKELAIQWNRECQAAFKKGGRTPPSASLSE